MVCQGDAPIGAGKLTSEILDIMTRIHMTLQQIATPRVCMHNHEYRQNNKQLFF